MKVRIAGFQLTFHPKMSLDTLFPELQKNCGARFRFQLHNRILNVVKDGDLILGSLLTDRGHKNFVAIDEQTNELSRGTLGIRKNFGAFNFFILCKKTNKALITCYRDAGGPSFVFGVLEDFGNKALAEMKQKALAALKGGGSKSETTKVIAAHEPPCFAWTEIVGKENYEAVLKRWKRVGAIEIAYILKEYSPAFLPISDDDALDHGRLRLSFKRGTAVSRAVETLRSIWKGDEVKKWDTLKVDGIDEWGISRRVEIDEKIPSLFGELDHDKLIADPTSFDQDLKKSYVIRHLKEVIRDAPAIFGT
jgi:hypothetical protein